MELQEKKNHILRFVKLGLDLYSSCILAECTDEEIKDVENDPDFLKRVEVCNIIAEKDLLKKYELAMDIAAERGNTEPIKWRLGKLNPERWSDKIRPGEGDVFIPANIFLRGGNEGDDE